MLIIRSFEHWMLLQALVPNILPTLVFILNQAFDERRLRQE